MCSVFSLGSSAQQYKGTKSDINIKMDESQKHNGNCKWTRHKGLHIESFHLYNILDKVKL
jgi:hypothetical protein